VGVGAALGGEWSRPTLLLKGTPRGRLPGRAARFRVPDLVSLSDFVKRGHSEMQDRETFT
jgi:hypothetical protein